VPLLDHVPEGRGIPSGPSGQLVHGAVQVAVHHQQVAVRLRQHHCGVGGDVLQSVLGGEAQLVVANQRVGLDEHVGA
jgi:hypothetical protein